MKKLLLNDRQTEKLGLDRVEATVTDGNKHITDKVHLQVTFAAFSRMESLCGENMGYVEIDGVLRHIYGGAKRTSDIHKANCKKCIRIKNIIDKERSSEE